MKYLALMLLAPLQSADPDLSKYGETHVAKCGIAGGWSADGRLLWGGSEKGKKGLLIAWDPSAKSKQRDVKGQLETLGAGYIGCQAAAGRVFGLAVSKDNVPHVEVFEDRKGEYQRAVVFKERLTSPKELRVSPDGVNVAVADGNAMVGLGDADDGTVRAILDGRLLGEGGYRCMAFDAQSKRLAIGWGAARVQVWNLKEKRVERTVNLNADATGVCFRPDGQALAVGNAKNEIELWDLGTGSRTSTWTGHSATPAALGFSPGAKYLVSADSSGAIRVWDAAKGETIRQESVSGESFQLVQFHPEAKFFALIGRDIHIWGKK
jgi:WD40 repeat protein